MTSLGILIPTLNAAQHLPSCLSRILQSSFADSNLSPKVLVIDSSSTDETVDIALRYGAQVKVIARKEFNHGLTREMGRKFLATDIIVMMTPDAYLENSTALSLLVEPIRTGKAAVAYGRQLSHLGADLLESFPREFNYPERSQLRTWKDLDRYGVYTYFCSDSFAAYSTQALDEIGGFSRVSFGEDTIVTAKLLKQGYAIAYVAEAQVRHSHNYSLKEEFKRYIEIGKFRREHIELLNCASGDRKRGWEYQRALIKKLWGSKRSLIPYAILQCLMKWFGYQLGKRLAIMKKVS